MCDVSATCEGLVLSGKRSDVSEAIATVLRPLISNLLREPQNPKFRRVRSANPKIASALASISGGDQLMRVAGFTMVSDLEKGEQFWHFEGDSASLLRAERAISALEEASNDRGAQVDRCDDRNFSDEMPLLKSRAAARNEEERRERLAALEKRAAADAREVEERRAAERDALDEERRQQADFAAGSQLVDQARLTIHHTGRLRNASFGASNFTVRSMRHGRSFACTCPPENLEAHWHVRTSNLLYSYLVHLNPDASAVVHVGDEHGYQYNTLPGTEHFGKTIHIAHRRIVKNSTPVTSGGAEDPSSESKTAIDHRAPNVPVTACHYCGVSFDTLWI